MKWFLYIAGAVTFGVYFLLFRNAFRGLAIEERRRLIAKARFPWWYYVLLLIPLAGIIVASSLAIRVGMVIAVIMLAVWHRVNYARRLKRLDFSDEFRRQLVRIFPLSLLAAALLLAATILFTM